MTRFYAFHLRNSMRKKLGDEYAPALLTAGQKKPLKKEKRSLPAPRVVVRPAQRHRVIRS